MEQILFSMKTYKAIIVITIIAILIYVVLAFSVVNTDDPIIETDVNLNIYTSDFS